MIKITTCFFLIVVSTQTSANSTHSEAETFNIYRGYTPRGFNEETADGSQQLEESFKRPYIACGIKPNMVFMSEKRAFSSLSKGDLDVDFFRPSTVPPLTPDMLKIPTPSFADQLVVYANRSITINDITELKQYSGVIVKGAWGNSPEVLEKASQYLLNSDKDVESDSISAALMMVNSSRADYAIWGEKVSADLIDNYNLDNVYIVKTIPPIPFQLYSWLSPKQSNYLECLSHEYKKYFPIPR